MRFCGWCGIVFIAGFLFYRGKNRTAPLIFYRHDITIIWLVSFLNLELFGHWVFVMLLQTLYVGIVGVQYITLMNTYTAINNRLMNLWQFSEEHSKLIVHTLSWFCQVYTIEKVFVVIREMKWKILRWELIILSFNCECYTWYIYLYFVQLVGFMRCDMQWSYAMITFPITWFVYIYYFSLTTCDI